MQLKQIRTDKTQSGKQDKKWSESAIYDSWWVSHTEYLLEGEKELLYVTVCYIVSYIVYFCSESFFSYPNNNVGAALLDSHISEFIYFSFKFFFSVFCDVWL